MADRIVQLKDKAGDNIYPIAGNPAAPVASSTTLGMVKVGTSMKIDANSNLNVNENGVTTGKIADGAVTSAKLADGTVTTAKIANGAVTSAKLTFPIKIESTGGWKDARDKAVVVNTNKSTGGGYAPGVDIKSKNGDWSIGVIDSTDTLYFSYVTDADYKAGNNRSTYQTLSTDGNNSFIPNMAKVVTYTTTDPGKNSNLAANRFVAVYEN